MMLMLFLDSSVLLFLMCLLFLIFGKLSHHGARMGMTKSLGSRPLLLFSVRDENFHRQTRRGCVDGSVYAPKDMEAGGTWLSFNISNRRFAVVLNYDESESGACHACEEGMLSRGILPAMFTESTSTTSEFIDEVKKSYDRFNGFSLIFGDDEECHYISNRCQDSPVPLAPNVIHGFSNGALFADSAAWPRIGVGKSIIEAHAQSELLSIYDEQSCRLILQKLVVAFRTCEFVNQDLTSRGTCHERLILPPTAYGQHNLYGTRTLTAIGSFCDSEEQQNEEILMKMQGGSGGTGTGLFRSGVRVVEADFDSSSGQWCDDEHVLLAGD